MSQGMTVRNKLVPAWVAIVDRVYQDGKRVQVSYWGGQNGDKLYVKKDAAKNWEPASK